MTTICVMVSDERFEVYAGLMKNSFKVKEIQDPSSAMMSAIMISTIKLAMNNAQYALPEPYAIHSDEIKMQSLLVPLLPILSACTRFFVGVCLVVTTG